MVNRRIVFLLVLLVIVSGYFSLARAEEKVVVAVLDLEVGEGISEKTAKILSDSL